MATDKLVDFDHVTDYISREAAIDAVDVCNLHRGIIDALQSIISDIPSTDVVEVVRCRDCKHYKEGELLGPSKFCYFWRIGTGLNTADNDFCSKGERRTDNG